MKTPTYDPGRDVAERLRGLESRLDILSGGRGTNTQALREAFAGHEERRGKQYAEALRQVGGFAVDVTRAVGAGLDARMRGVADKAIAAVSEDRFPADGLDHARVAGQEAMVLEMLERFGALQCASQETVHKLGAAMERLDELWKQEEAPGAGGWRSVMRAVGEQVAFEKNQEPAFTEHYKGELPEAGLPPAVRSLRCARCGYETVRRIQRESLLEEALRMVFVAPYRCSTCGVRSYHFRYAIRYAVKKGG